MMHYQTRQPNLTNVRATHYTRGWDHLYYMDSGLGNLMWLPLNPATLLVSKTETLTLNKRLNLNTLGGQELQWDSLGKNLGALNLARVLPLTGFTSLADILPATLVDADWNSVANNNKVPEDGTSTAGRCYAVRIPNGGEFHYAKVRVYAQGGQTWVEWVTYSVSPNPYRVGAGFSDVRDIVVSEYETALYLTGQYDLDGAYYVLYSPRASNALSPYPDFSSQAQPVHGDPLDEPQQMVMDGGFIYVVDNGSLWRIDPTSGDQACVVTGLTGGTGLLLSSTGIFLKAYISDAAGHIYVVDLSDFASGSSPIPLPPPTYTLNTTQAGFMNWADEEHNALYIALHDTREVARLDLLAGNISIEGSTSAASPGPWSIEVVSENRLFVSCETEIGQFTRSILLSGDLLLGIGLIPFGYINNSVANPANPGPNDGKANTSTAPGYYFSAYPNLAFAGDLSLMVNHELAWNNGIRFYSVKLQNLVTGQTRSISDAFYDFKWIASALPPHFVNTATGSVGSLYPIRDPADLWYNPYLAALLRTSIQDNGHNVLTVEFFDANKQLVANGSFKRLLLIDNTRCNVRLELPRIGVSMAPPAPGVYPTLSCGCLSYTSKDDLVEQDFVAWQPQGSGSYSLRFSRGGVDLPALAQGGGVTTSPLLRTKQQTSASKPIRIGHILGNCDVANVVISISGPSNVIDGFGWVNRGSSTHRTFTLIKGTVSHTPWTEP
ncbi:hypothetical protein P2318_00415 [Myxococcaceae bacterium GXIMD 01537]